MEHRGTFNMVDDENAVCVFENGSVVNYYKKDAEL